MTSEGWERIKEVFTSALEINAEDRDAFLARECSGDDTLKQEVTRLLLEFQRMGPFWVNRSPN